MTQNIVIDFTEKGLEKIVDDLVKIGAISEKQAAEYKASNDVYKARQEIVSKLFSSQTKLATETSKATKSMDDLAKSTDKVAKTIINGATNQAIKDTGKAIDDVEVKVKKYDNSLKGLKQQYKDLVAQAIEVGENSPFGEKLLKDAGAVKDRILDIELTTKNFASDTGAFDAIGQGIRGIGAGFQIAQGAQALFGTGNKDLERQLLKVQGTMALVSGLTEVQNLLQKESAFRLGLTNAQLFIKNTLERVGITFKVQQNVAEATGETIKKRVVVVQAVENALTSQSVIVRGAATAAQWLLNNAMLAFPLLAIIGGLVALIGLFGGFGNSIDKAADMQNKMNELQKENLKIMQAQDDLINKLSSERVESIQRELDMLVAQKASTDEIRAKEKQLQNERSFNASFQKGFHAVEIENLEKNRLAVIGLTAKLAAYNKEKALSGSDKYDNEIEAIKGQLEIVQQLVKIGEEVQANASNISLERAKQVIEQQQEIALEGLAFQKDIINAKLRFAKVGSEQELALQLALAKNAKDTAIANLKASNESRADIEAAYREKQLDLTIAYNNTQLQKKIDLVNAELQSVRIGSVQETELKLKALDYQNQIDLNNRKITDEKKKELTEKFIKDTNDLIYNASKKLRDDEINRHLLVNDAKLSAVQKGVLSELQLKQNQLVLQEQLELNNIDRSIQGTELGEATKNAIIAKYAEKNRLLNLEAVEFVIAARENENARLLDVYQRRSDIEANNVRTTLQRRQALELESFDNKIELLEIEKQADTERYLAGALTYEQYQKRLTEILDEENLIRLGKQNAADAIERENLLRKVDMATQLANESLNAISGTIQSRLEIETHAINKELAANEDLYKNKNLTDIQYLANKQQIERRLGEMKRKAAQQEKDVALFQIGINTAQAAIKAFSTSGPLLGAIESALIIAFGAIQYGIVASKPIPEFAKGTENAPKGWAWVGEKGPELIWMQGGEKVKTHEESVKMTETPSLRKTYLDKVDRAPIPSEQAEQAMARFAQQGLGMDYTVLSKMIGSEVGNHISKMPLTLMSFDRNGFQASIAEGNSTNSFLDSRYSSN